MCSYTFFWSLSLSLPLQISKQSPQGNVRNGSKETRGMDMVLKKQLNLEPKGETGCREVSGKSIRHQLSSARPDVASRKEGEPRVVEF